MFGTRRHSRLYPFGSTDKEAKMNQTTFVLLFCSKIGQHRLLRFVQHYKIGDKKRRNLVLLILKQKTPHFLSNVIVIVMVGIYLRFLILSSIIARVADKSKMY